VEEESAQLPHATAPCGTIPDAEAGGEMERVFLEYFHEHEHAYFEYLYNLSLVSITFVGLAGLFIGFKTAGRMTNFYVLLLKNHFLLGFTVVGASLLPPLLALVPPSLLSPDAAWRGASVIAAITPLLFSITYPSRRRRVMKADMPTHTKVLVAFYYFVAALLLVNTYVNLPALYAFAVTLQQFINVWTFIYALRFLDVPETAGARRKKFRAQ
jgi:hypothetical protein